MQNVSLLALFKYFLYRIKFQIRTEGETESEMHGQYNRNNEYMQKLGETALDFKVFALTQYDTLRGKIPHYK